MKHYSLAVIPGDGIGLETVPESLKVLKAIEDIHGGIQFDTRHFDWSCQYYLQHGKMMPDNGLDVLKDYDSILFGAVGEPSVPDHISVWELILPIRRAFDQYVNLRPIKLLKGLECPLKGKDGENIDFVVIRENTEGEYSNVGGRLFHGTPREIAMQNNIFTRYGTERIVRYAYSYAASHHCKSLISATKSNAMNYTMTFWDEVVKDVGNEFPNIATSKYHVDALASYFITRPETFEVIVASNLFGDILTDLGAAIVGGLGIGASGNINPERKYPSMFEPIHGSAPDIAGKGIANPIAQVWSVGIMLDHLGHTDLYHLILDAIENVLMKGEVRTPDLGGKASTAELGDALVHALKTLAVTK